MRDINKIILIGYLGADPKPLGDQNIACQFPLATTESWKDKKSKKRVNKTTWHTVVAFNGLAETCLKYGKKGYRVYVEGSQQNQYWNDNGIKKLSSQVKALDVSFDLPKLKASEISDSEVPTIEVPPLEEAPI